MGLHHDRPCECAADVKTILAALARIETTQEKIMTALADLQAEDTALQATVAQVLTDFAAALAAAGSDPAAIEQVVTDMQAMAATLTAADPATPVPPAPTA
jgi:hypothetical protein